MVRRSGKADAATRPRRVHPGRVGGGVHSATSRCELEPGLGWLAPEIMRYTLPDRIQYQGMVGMVTTPVDRFQGLHMDDTFEFSLGTFTPLFDAKSGANLSIKVNAAIQGEIRLALTYYNTGLPEYYGFKPESVAGMGMEECIPVTGDVLAGEIKWKGASDLKSLVGKRVELRIAMRQATLFCVEVGC